MSKHGRARGLGCLAALLAVSMQACAVGRVPSVAPSAEASATHVLSTTATMPTMEAPRGTATAPSNGDPTPTAAAASVTIVAAKGNIFIRRGPDFAFNAIGALLEGQSATVLARDVLAEWVQVPLPEQPSQTGWISIQSHYTVVEGDIMTLPEMEPDYYPVAASIRNCTLHQMLISPGNIILPAVTSFPFNDQRVNPGIYVVIDTDVNSYPEVAKVDVREGASIDIRVDGNGDKKKCPLP